MTRDKTRRVLVTVVAAVVLVGGGAVGASGQIGALRGQATSASPSDGPETDSASDEATDATEDESTDEATDEATDESTDQATDESTDDETTDGSTEDETTDDESDDEQSGDEESDAKGPKAPCTLTSPPNRAASGTAADRHPGWSRGKHFGWCVAAARHGTTERPAKPGKVGGEKHVDKPGRSVKTPKKPHPGKGHRKHH